MKTYTAYVGHQNPVLLRYGNSPNIAITPWPPRVPLSILKYEDQVDQDIKKGDKERYWPKI